MSSHSTMSLLGLTLGKHDRQTNRSPALDFDCLGSDLLFGESYLARVQSKQRLHDHHAINYLY
jgi:hypothetical protein